MTLSISPQQTHGTKTTADYVTENKNEALTAGTDPPADADWDYRYVIETGETLIFFFFWSAGRLQELGR